MRFYLKISILFILSVLLIGCSGRRNKAERRDAIPQNKMIDIITDLYITDGLMIMPMVHEWYESSDSIAAYRDVIESHGYTKEDFDRTMRFYYIKKPKVLMKMYEQALSRLSEMETRFDQENMQIQSRITNYWEKENILTASDSTTFDIKFNYWNIYNFTFTATVYPGDQSVNPKPVIYTCHPDSVETGRRFYIQTFEYVKDGRPHRYAYRIEDPDRSRLRLVGNLFDSESGPSAEKHFIIEDISITY